MKKHITAFYLETLLLVAVFAAIIPVLTGIFGGARAESARAAHLTHAVQLAENAAEAFSASHSLEEVGALLDGQGSAVLEGDALTVTQDEYKTRITWEPEENLVSGRVTVYYNEDVLYTLDTAVYLQEGV